VPLEATVSGGTPPYTVQFFYGGSPTSITTLAGTGVLDTNTNSYKFADWVPVAGTHPIGGTPQGTSQTFVVRATVTDNASPTHGTANSGTATIGVANCPVQTGPPTPTPATIRVK
jgi:hypothetical protein